MDLQSAELLAATTDVVELTSWQKIMRVAFSPDALREIAMYVLLMVLLGAISKVVYDIKETRRPTLIPSPGFCIALLPPIIHITSEPQVTKNDTMLGNNVEIFALLRSTSSHALL